MSHDSRIPVCSSSDSPRRRVWIVGVVLLLGGLCGVVGSTSSTAAASTNGIVSTNLSTDPAVPTDLGQVVPGGVRSAIAHIDLTNVWGNGRVDVATRWDNSAAGYVWQVMPNTCGFTVGDRVWRRVVGRDVSCSGCDVPVERRRA
jgi:hypothetical protein